MPDECATAGIVISDIPPAPQVAHGRSGTLAGLRLAVKDNIDVQGILTTQGSQFAGIEAGAAATTAPVIEALVAAGAIPSTKVNLHEFAYGVTSANPWFGAVPNPKRSDRISGGSSGGSAAAIAAGIAELALGTDTAGSIRIPAACVGVVGLRPRAGLLNRRGVQPLCPSFDTVGPMAGNVRLVALAWDALLSGAAATDAGAGLHFSTNEASSTTLRTRLHHRAEESIRVAALDVHALPSAATTALASIGATCVQSSGFGLHEIDRAVEALWPAFRVEASRTHAAWFPSRASEYDPSVARKLAAAQHSDLTQHRAALATLSTTRQQLLTAWDRQGIDALVMPTIGCRVPGIDEVEEEYQDALGNFTAAFSGLNLPALAIGGIQIVGRTEADVLTLGLALEDAGLTPEPAE